MDKKLLSVDELEAEVKKLGLQEEDKKDQNPTVAEIVDFILDQDIYLFHDQDREGWVEIQRNSHREIYKIMGKDFSSYMSLLIWNEYNKAISRTIQDTVMRTIKAKAVFEGKQHDLYIRTAWYKGALWYDLGDWRAVMINEDGWKIVDEPPILFKRFTHQIPQIAPVEGGNIEDILQFVNLNCQNNEHIKLLFLTYLVAILIPDIPRAILVLHGFHGSAKSTFFKIVKSLIDPSYLDVMTHPKNQTELVQMLSHHYLILLDNLSELKNKESDDLCRACTGQSFSKRRLYTDDDDLVYHYIRAIGLNGINLVASKPDLLDRSLMFELDSIPEDKKLEENELFKKLEEEKSKILGAIFTLLSKAITLKKAGEIKIGRMPRLADYAVWCSAVAVAMGSTVEDFMKAYDFNIRNQNSEAIDANVVALVITEYMKNVEELRGESGEVYEKLRLKAESMDLLRTNFPKSHNWLWRKIKLVKPNLLSEGINVEYLGTRRPRQIVITNTRFEENSENKYNKNDDSTDNTDKVDGKDQDKEDEMVTEMEI